jgi:hypothetical protein
VDYKPPDIRARIVAAILFFAPILLLWGVIDLCRYLFFGDNPTLKEIVWVVLACIVLFVWTTSETVRDIMCHLYENKERMNDLESRVAALEKGKEN